MKTYKNLYRQITAFENMLEAAQKAQKGKRNRPDAVRFFFKLEDNLFQLQRELEDQTYHPSKYKTFYIHDPKKRMISAASFRDRVVHHALCNVTEPLFERTFIYDSYANRKGKGMHKAIERYQFYARKYPYVLKCDIQKFFPSLDHEILKSELRWKIQCPKTLWLMDRIIDNSNLQEDHTVYFLKDDLFTPYNRRRGLPIGNLTSQIWANVYLNRFDHFVKERLQVQGYIRYVDDFVLFSCSKSELWAQKRQISKYLSNLRLLVHPNKSQVFKVAKGLPFLGFHIFPQYRYVKKQNRKRYRRFLNKKLQTRKTREYDPEQLESGLNSWLGHIRFGQSKRLEYQTFWYLWHYGVNLFRHPRGSWRLLE